MVGPEFRPPTPEEQRAEAEAEAERRREETETIRQRGSLIPIITPVVNLIANTLDNMIGTAQRTIEWSTAIYDDIYRQLDKIPRIASDLTNLVSRVTGIASDLANLASRVTGIASDLTNLASRVTGIATDVWNLAVTQAQHTADLLDIKDIVKWWQRTRNALIGNLEGALVILFLGSVETVAKVGYWLLVRLWDLEITTPPEEPK
jgi:methyl-accepting chemotaxis protein